ncbi:MAG TPA: molecular chaperone [Cyanobacteria bacterium UBA8530]|nr:molecular chaperone [Cyanobacteria bacterium UBA8530]
MPVGPQYPFGVDLDNARQEMERLFRDFTTTLGAALPGTRLQMLARGEFYPNVDVYEKNDQVIVRCDLPGLEQKDVEVLTEKNSVTISGEAHREENIVKEEFFQHERAFGVFRRVITLPKPINFEQARATFRNGVLTIMAPIAEEAKRPTRNVPIETI